LQKRFFDIIFSLALLLCIWPVLLISFILACIDTKSTGVFTQIRVGQHGALFKIFKLKTMTWSNDQAKISKVGNFLRKYKLDELPQIFNILLGNMSVVGPRPDIPGYYDILKGEQRKLLVLKPGLTSKASIKYRNEENILQIQKNPLEYNDTVIFPDKVKMNLEYLEKQSLKLDLLLVFETLKTYIK
jgi:lipopolysaccharide/colanic/teichoic acid biosynthesis glycosyltransferase